MKIDTKVCLSYLGTVMLMLTVSPKPAQARCAYLQYTVTGSVRDVDGNAVENARVLVFFDDAKYSGSMDYDILDFFSRK